MQKIFFILLVALVAVGCDNDDDARNRNPFLLDSNFSIRLSPIQSQDLQFPSNAIFINNAAAGIRGIYAINTGSGIFAWEASDPNHVPNSCSTMQLNGIEVTCQCEDANTYNLFTGQSSGAVLEYPMLQYRVSQNGDEITISN